MRRPGPIPVLSGQTLTSIKPLSGTNAGCTLSDRAEVDRAIGFESLAICRMKNTSQPTKMIDAMLAIATTSPRLRFGGGLAGFGSVVFGLKINTIHFQMGFQNGLYAFTAAVLGGIGNIPGAVIGALLIGLIRAFGSAFVGEQWVGAMVFATLIVILVFRPQGLLGARVREKV